MRQFRIWAGTAISLAFLAPDIVETIIDGMQPMSLTPERLKKACPLPASWEEQRAFLLAWARSATGSLPPHRAR